MSGASPNMKPPPCFSRFFIIKSFTEEDVHKAIKYHVWSSTETGNQLLEQAFLDVSEVKKEAKQEKDLTEEDDPMLEQAKRTAEVYLLFSVNKSRHFCGVAMMKSNVRTDIRHDDLWRNSHKWPGSLKL